MCCSFWSECALRVGGSRPCQSILFRLNYEFCIHQTGNHWMEKRHVYNFSSAPRRHCAAQVLPEVPQVASRSRTATGSSHPGASTGGLAGSDVLRRPASEDLLGSSKRKKKHLFCEAHMSSVTSPSPPICQATAVPRKQSDTEALAAKPDTEARAVISGTEARAVKF